MFANNINSPENSYETAAQAPSTREIVKGCFEDFSKTAAYGILQKISAQLTPDPAMIKTVDEIAKQYEQKQTDTVAENYYASLQRSLRRDYPGILS